MMKVRMLKVLTCLLQIFKHQLMAAVKGALKAVKAQLRKITLPLFKRLLVGVEQVEQGLAATFQLVL